MLLITIEAADLGAVAAQILLQSLGIQAIWNPTEVQNSEAGLWKKAAFTQDLGTPVQI